MEPQAVVSRACPACGAQIAPGHTSCGQCGASLPGETVLRVTEAAALAWRDRADETVAAASAGVSSHLPPERVTPPHAPPLPRLLEPGTAFGNRYRIIKLLGIGGMGAVYQAHDDELGIVVAIKTIRPGAGTDPATATDAERRFKRELVLARQVTHPNVVRIHDLGEIDGTKYITMPFVNGDTLAAVLERDGRLPVPRALAIFRQIVSGMRAAHEKGVVHRDLKPANIMLEDGVAYIMDFGIARHVERGTLMTVVGVVVGSIEYMAPEQAQGLNVDQRADIYALGLILRDMIAGRAARPQTDNPLGDLMQRLTTPPPPVRTVVPEAPEPVEQIITRCLQIDPAARFESAAALELALAELDESGHPKPASGTAVAPPIRPPRARWFTRAAALLVMLGVAAGTWFAATYPPAPDAPVSHAPVSVLIADVQNGLDDPAFDRTLEPVFKLALEGADFITAYDRLGIARSLGVRSPDVLDERAATEIAVREGVAVVLAGSLARQGGGYGISVKATRAVNGEVIASARETASGRDQIIAVTTRLATSVRKALGDDTSDAAQRFAMDTLSATSLEVVRDYASAMDALSRSRFEDARQGFASAVKRDPSFGLAYAGMAIASRNLDDQQNAVKYVKEAVRYLDGMTERERYRTRGLFYYLTNDYQACVKEYGDLIERFSGDAAARNNLALCLTYMRNLPRAVAEMRQVVEILPKRALYRENLALYSSYSGDFQGADREVRKMSDTGLFGRLALAFAQLGRGEVSEAASTYASIQKIDALGASYAASGLADIALYEGRFSDAAQLFRQGAAEDLKAKDVDRAANKLAALANVQVLRGNPEAAIAAVEEALAQSQALKIQFLAARVFAEAGAIGKARELSTALGAQLQAEPQAYARIVDGLIALKERDPRLAIERIGDANRHLDTWIGHFELGRAYLEAGAYTQADSEFDRCLKRRGEALALFLDEEPTYGIFPAVYYYQGRARDGLNSASFADSYRAFLDIRGKSSDDPLVSEVRRRGGY